MNFFSSMFGTPNYKEISVAELALLAEGTRLIDVRQAEEFSGDLSHLDQAELVPLATLAQAASNWDKEAPYVLICRSGNRSGQACRILTQLGFTNVTNLRGGMSAVRAAG